MAGVFAELDRRCRDARGKSEKAKSVWNRAVAQIAAETKGIEDAGCEQDAARKSVEEQRERVKALAGELGLVSDAAEAFEACETSCTQGMERLAAQLKA